MDALCVHICIYMYIYICIYICIYIYKYYGYPHIYINVLGVEGYCICTVKYFLLYNIHMYSHTCIKMDKII